MNLKFYASWKHFGIRKGTWKLLELLLQLKQVIHVLLHLCKSIYWSSNHEEFRRLWDIAHWESHRYKSLFFVPFQCRHPCKVCEYEYRVCGYKFLNFRCKKKLPARLAGSIYCEQIIFPMNLSNTYLQNLSTLLQDFQVQVTQIQTTCLDILRYSNFNVILK